MTYTTVETNVVTGEVTIREWTEEEIAARKERLLPMTWQNIREQRNNLLKESDIKVLPDVWITLSLEKQNEWLEYRQKLRDLPETIVDPYEDFEWPTKPT